MKKTYYLNLFNYLKEFTKLRTTTVTDIRSSSQYIDTIWFANLLETIRVKSSITSLVDFQDNWLTVRKPGTEPKYPKFKGLSAELEIWIEQKSLTDEVNGPQLKDSIFGQNGSMFLSDNQHIEELFEKFIDEDWFLNLDNFRIAISQYETELQIHKFEAELYGQLFGIYSKISLFKEDYELVLGFGLLHFNQSINHPHVCRHLFTTPAEIVYEENNFGITVGPSEDFRISIESEFIENTELFDPFNLGEAERIFKSKINDSQDINVFGSDVKLACNAYASTMRSDCAFIDEVGNADQFQTEPKVFFSPAIILRKRDSKGITNLYKAIIENIEKADEDIDLPLFDTIIGFRPNLENEQKIDYEDKTCTSVYFPNLYNEEQLQIALKANRFKNVLVQGPPGTGKSLTISNLICDLIAKGNKVLVTAQTERALKVLGDKLPEEFQKLSVSLLGSEHFSRRKKNPGPIKPGLTLESTINSIQQKHSEGINLSNLSLQIERDEELLKSQKENLEYKKIEWAEIRKSDVERHHISDYYSGTLLEIARKLEADASQYEWYEDDFYDLNHLGIVEDVKTYIEKRKQYINDIGNELSKSLPDTSNLLPILDFKMFITAKKNLTFYQKTGKQYLSILPKESQKVQSLLQELENKLDILEEDFEFLKGKKTADFQSVIKELIAKHTKSESAYSKLNLSRLEFHRENIRIRFPENKDLVSLKGHLNILLNYAQKGNAISGWQFSFKKHIADSQVKAVFYLLDLEIINSKRLQTVGEIQDVLEHIQFHQIIGELESHWQLGDNNSDQPLSSRILAIASKVEEAYELKTRLEEFEKLKSEIETACGLTFNSATKEEIRFWSESIRFRISYACCIVNEPKVLKMNAYLDSENFHYIARQLRKASVDGDPVEYEKYFGNIDLISNQQTEYKKFITLKNRISITLPKLFKKLKELDFDKSLLDGLPAAINFRYAQNEVLRRTGSDPRIVQDEIRSIEGKIRKMSGEIGSKKAWHSTLVKLSAKPGLISHLVAWSLAALKMKGTGKRALKFRSEAQTQMSHCQEAVPCWIMPLYKVAETITPTPQMFDYVIVDESSQLSADALFLLYLGKKVIVVGDDKQTAPEFPGISEDSVKALIARFLRTIPFGKFLGLESSFFDQANILADSRMVLQEHFRCMPEIIEFSNRNFYKPSGKELFPLRQYSENRLAPLKSVYCSDALKEGEYSHITNRKEAEAISDKISELIKLPEYEGKTFGVIALQGNSQAERIEKEIKSKIGIEEYEKRELVCGNSASFQGDERDIIFLSLITAPNHNRIALTKPEDERRFNVAASRAKDQMWLFHSVHLEELSSHDLRHKLLSYFLNFHSSEIWEEDKVLEPSGGRNTINLPSRFRSWFEVDVFNELVGKGYKVIPNYKVIKTKYEIDLVPVLPNGTKVAIECDGDEFHGPEQLEQDLARQIILERCGWRFFRLRGSEYYSNRKKSLEPLWNLLELSQKERYTDAEKKEVLKQEYPSNQIAKIDLEESTKLEAEEKVVQSKPLVFSSLTSNPDIETHTDLLVFTNQQNVYKIYNSERFDSSGKLKPSLGGNQSKLKDWALSRIEFEPNEKPIYIAGTSDYSGFMLFGFENGNFAKVNLTAFQTVSKRKRLEKAYSDASRLIIARHLIEEVDLVARSSIGKVIVFNSKQLANIQSKNSGGVQVMKTKNGSTLKSVETLIRTKLVDSEYYRISSLPAIGNFLRKQDEI